MAAPQGGGASQEDIGNNFLWATAAGFIFILVLWFIFKPQLVHFFLSLKLYESKLMALFMPTRMAAVQSKLLNLMQQAREVDVQTLYDAGHLVGVWYRIPIVLIFLVFAAVVYTGNSTRVFRNIYNMKSFVKAESVNWPQISPIIDLDLVKQDIDKGAWAMALTPMQFAKRNKLIDEVVRQNSESTSWKDRETIEAVLKKGEATRVFTMQLGALWQGIEKLPPHIRALFAVFAARLNADSKIANELLMQFARTAALKIDYTGVDDLLKKHYNTKSVQQIVQSHAYVYTVLASMLQGAREDGVQATADFLWLKPVDRRLWYTLNVVGRQTPFVEVAGIFAHWTAEREAGRRLLVPMVEEATKALERALREVVYRREE